MTKKQCGSLSSFFNQLPVTVIISAETAADITLQRCTGCTIMSAAPFAIDNSNLFTAYNAFFLL
jgi:hypothetical protein